MTKSESLFRTLCGEVQQCRACPRMNTSIRVLSGASGAIHAPIMFIGEAPGRLGADNSQIPFHGDKAGHNFEELLEFANLSRAECFITNAVLCNPKDEKGNNSTPLPVELANCSSFLRRQLELVNPKVVVTLGISALSAVSAVEPHELRLSTAVRTANRWFGRILIPLYHPGQRAMLHRSYANQRSDYQFVREQVDRLGGPPKRKIGGTKADVALIAREMIVAAPGISYFALHKLFYLLELAHVRKHGTRLTNAFFIRQKEGPYCVDLHPAKIRRAFPSLRYDPRKAQFYLSESQQGLFEEGLHKTVSKSVRQEVQEILEKYGRLSDANLKSVVYLTKPMREMLRRETKEQVNLYNVPIDVA